MGCVCAKSEVTPTESSVSEKRLATSGEFQVNINVKRAILTVTFNERILQEKNIRQQIRKSGSSDANNNKSKDVKIPFKNTHKSMKIQHQTMTVCQ